MKKNIYTVCIVLSGCLWGLMGLFRRRLGDMGLDSHGVVMVRCATAAVMFAALMLVKNPGEFVVKPRDIWCFVGSGIFALLFFTTCYFQAMNLMSLSAAAVLLYTAPVFVILMSAFLFKEEFTRAKLIALILAFAGCALVSGIVGGTKLTGAGLLYGLGAGFGYALYSIFSKIAIRKGYSGNTINFWSCTLAFLGSGIIWGFTQPMQVMFSDAGNLLYCLLAGLITCFLPYALYVFGLTKTEAGRASIMVSIEPVVATVAGFAVFGERPDVYMLAGIALVLAAIVILNLKGENING